MKNYQHFGVVCLEMHITIWMKRCIIGYKMLTFKLSITDITKKKTTNSNSQISAYMDAYHNISFF